MKLSKYSKDGVSTPIETYSAVIEAGNNITGNIKSFENDELSNNDINIKDKYKDEFVNVNIDMENLKIQKNIVKA